MALYIGSAFRGDDAIEKAKMGAHDVGNRFMGGGSEDDLPPSTALLPQELEDLCPPDQIGRVWNVLAGDPGFEGGSPAEENEGDREELPGRGPGQVAERNPEGVTLDECAVEVNAQGWFGAPFVGHGCASTDVELLMLRRFGVGLAAGKLRVRPLHDAEGKDEEHDGGDDHTDVCGALVAGFQFRHRL
jgi:hypothetical protein